MWIHMKNYFCFKGSCLSTLLWGAKILMGRGFGCFIFKGGRERQSNTWSSINGSNDRNHLCMPKKGCRHRFVWPRRRRKALLLREFLMSGQTLSRLGETPLLLPFVIKGLTAESVGPPAAPALGKSEKGKQMSTRLTPSHAMVNKTNPNAQGHDKEKWCRCLNQWEGPR